MPGLIHAAVQVHSAEHLRARRPPDPRRRELGASPRGRRRVGTAVTSALLLLCVTTRKTMTRLARNHALCKSCVHTTCGCLP